MKEMNISEKFSIGNIPKSTTNKTYSSLTVNYKENDQLASNSSRGLSQTGAT
jgi:hypothetical protein